MRIFSKFYLFNSLKKKFNTTTFISRLNSKYSDLEYNIVFKNENTCLKTVMNSSIRQELNYLQDFHFNKKHKNNLNLQFQYENWFLNDNTAIICFENFYFIKRIENILTLFDSLMFLEVVKNNSSQKNNLKLIIEKYKKDLTVLLSSFLLEKVLFFIEQFYIGTLQEKELLKKQVLNYLNLNLNFKSVFFSLNNNCFIFEHLSFLNNNLSFKSYFNEEISVLLLELLNSLKEILSSSYLREFKNIFELETQLLVDSLKKDSTISDFNQWSLELLQKEKRLLEIDSFNIILDSCEVRSLKKKIRKLKYKIESNSLKSISIQENTQLKVEFNKKKEFITLYNLLFNLIDDKNNVYYLESSFNNTKYSFNNVKIDSNILDYNKTFLDNLRVVLDKYDTKISLEKFLFFLNYLEKEEWILKKTRFQKKRLVHEMNFYFSLVEVLLNYLQEHDQISLFYNDNQSFNFSFFLTKQKLEKKKSRRKYFIEWKKNPAEELLVEVPLSSGNKKTIYKRIKSLHVQPKENFYLLTLKTNIKTLLSSKNNSYEVLFQEIFNTDLKKNKSFFELQKLHFNDIDSQFCYFYFILNDMVFLMDTKINKSFFFSVINFLEKHKYGEKGAFISLQEQKKFKLFFSFKKPLQNLDLERIFSSKIVNSDEKSLMKQFTTEEERKKYFIDNIVFLSSALSELKMNFNFNVENKKVKIETLNLATPLFFPVFNNLPGKRNNLKLLSKNTIITYLNNDIERNSWNFEDSFKILSGFDFQFISKKNFSVYKNFKSFYKASFLLQKRYNSFLKKNFFKRKKKSCFKNVVSKLWLSPLKRFLTYKFEREKKMIKRFTPHNFKIVPWRKFYFKKTVFYNLILFLRSVCIFKQTVVNVNQFIFKNEQSLKSKIIRKEIERNFSFFTFENLSSLTINDCSNKIFNNFDLFLSLQKEIILVLEGRNKKSVKKISFLKSYRKEFFDVRKVYFSKFFNTSFFFFIVTFKTLRFYFFLFFSFVSLIEIINYFFQRKKLILFKYFFSKLEIINIFLENIIQLYREDILSKNKYFYNFKLRKMIDLQLWLHKLIVDKKDLYLQKYSQKVLNKDGMLYSRFDVLYNNFKENIKDGMLYSRLDVLYNNFKENIKKKKIKFNFKQFFTWEFYVKSALFISIKQYFLVIKQKLKSLY